MSAVMAKALLMSILVAALVIPFRAASAPTPARGARSVTMLFTAFVVIWAHALLYVLPLLNK